jgi:predicted O-methyltransferase YrrM
MSDNPTFPVAQYQFANTWFEDTAKEVWEQLIPQIKPKRILEIGSYEGASACYLIEKLAFEDRIELHCIDTWEGGIEHGARGSAKVDMTAVERRFLHNTRLASDRVSGNLELQVHKGFSDIQLSKLLAEEKRNYFDFIYIDGSHAAPDVLCDAILSFRLLRVGGLMAFDDYLWSEPSPYGVDPIRCPKPAIDSFTNIYCRKVQVLSAPLYQLYVQKIAD